MRIEEFLGRLHGVKELGNGEWLARCPAHDDSRQSLSVGRGDSKILVHCFVSCPVEQILEALALKPSDLFEHPREQAQQRRIVKEYDYRDERGELLYQVVRFEPKDFRPRRPDGQGGWTWGLGDARRVVYRLPEIKGKARIYLVEGEKDADNLWKAGLPATTSPSGSSSWRDDYARQIKEAGAREAVILPDNDDAGAKYAAQASASLRRLGLRTKTVALDDVPPKGDVSDWLARGHLGADLIALAGRTEEDADERVKDDGSQDGMPAEDKPEMDVDAHRTDTGNAIRFAHDWQHDVRYVPERKAFMVYDGTRWVKDEAGLAVQRATQTVIGIYREAEYAETPEERALLAKHAARSESASSIRGMLELAKHRPQLVVRETQLDRDPWALNVSNGTLDLRTGELRPHRTGDLITKLAPVPYDPAAECPMWRRFLSRIFAEDPSIIGFVQKKMGYGLTGLTREQCLFINWGGGANGKTTLETVVIRILGDYAGQIRPDTLMVKKHRNEIPNDVAALRGKRYIVTAESEEGDRLAESFVKQATGGEPLQARFMRAEWFEFVPEFKLTISTNHRPNIRGTDLAIWRRIRLLPFTVTIPEGEQDKELAEKLFNAEAPGILRWAVEGCLRWIADGLGTPEKVKIATEEYRAEMDAVGAFLEDCCRLHADGMATSKALYGTYAAWAERNAEKPMAKRTFGLRLRERGLSPDKNTELGRFWSGVELLHQHHDQHDEPQREEPPF
jgi:putative DNA primase/helicase